MKSNFKVLIAAAVIMPLSFSAVAQSKKQNSKPLTAEAIAKQKAAIDEASQILTDGKASIRAARASKKSKTKKAKKTVTKSGALTVPAKMQMASYSAGPQTTVAPQANPFTGAALTGVSGVKAEDKDKSKKPPLFNFNWISYNKLDSGAVENIPGSDQEVWGWQQPTFIFNLSKDVNLSVIPQFFNSWFGNPDRVQDDKVAASGGEPGMIQPYSLYMGNTSFAVTHKSIYKTGQFRFEGSLKYDAPTSERASLNGSFGENWNTLNFYQTVGKFDLWLQLIGRVYFQRYKTSSLLGAGGANKDKQLQNPFFRDYEILNVGYNWTSKFSTTLSLGAYNTSYYDDPNNNRPEYVKTVRVAAIDLTYNFTKQFGLSVGIFEEMLVNGQKQTWGNLPFDPLANEAGEFYLQGTFKIL